jgi:hypothetical protein
MPLIESTHSPRDNKISLLPLFVGLICIVLVIGSTLYFWSALITIRPLKIVTAWEQNGSAFEQTLAIQLIPRLEQSIAVNPLRAESYLTLARLYDQLAHNDGLVDKDIGDKTDRTNISTQNQQLKQSYLNLAEVNYKNAIQQQPTWDYAWARLAAFYSHNNKQQKLTLHVLNQAMLLGPYENETQKFIIPLIFEHGALVDEFAANREQAEKIVKHALKFHTHAVLTLDAAKQFNKLDQLAPLLSQQWHKNRLTKYMKELAAQAKDTTAETGHE